MNQEQEILKNIADGVDEYNAVDLSDLKAMSEILRKLNANLFYLTTYRVKAKQDWLSTYYNSKGKTNAAKEREADKDVIELYQYRYIMDAAKRIVNGLPSQMSIAKIEGN